MKSAPYWAGYGYDSAFIKKCFCYNITQNMEKNQAGMGRIGKKSVLASFRACCKTRLLRTFGSMHRLPQYFLLAKYRRVVYC
jgi:hypothetical protein